jgi:hypothetical protein
MTAAGDVFVRLSDVLQVEVVGPKSSRPKPSQSLKTPPEGAKEHPRKTLSFGDLNRV